MMLLLDHVISQVSKAFEVLEYVVQQSDKLDYYELAEIKMLYSKLLQCRNPSNLLCGQSLLDHVRQQEHTSLMTSSKATSLELLLEALHLLRMLCKDLRLSPSNDEVHGWLLLGKLLQCLNYVVTLLCWHGNCREAIYYCKEANDVCLEHNLYYWLVNVLLF